jgi:O-antigen ligase
VSSSYKNIKKVIWVYMIPLLGVIFFTIYNQAVAGFTEASAHIAMTPYYNDHTAYAAVIAFFIPVLISFVDDRSSTKTVRILSFVFAFLFTLAIVLSYTRAAWLALILSFLCYLIFLFKIPKWLIYSGIFLVLSVILINQTQLVMHLQKNDKVSSTDFSSHVQSVGNISTDDSNIERLNRWACAIRMWNKKPLLGYGPGTYMFKYAPFQKNSEKSGISTDFGTGGGSHSEYLGPLSEQGVLGPLWFILIGIVVILRTSKLLKRSQDRTIRGLAKGLLLGLVTYWIHGFMNYFLDTEKASAPFWGFIAALVALDIFEEQHREQRSAERATAEQSNVIE